MENTQSKDTGGYGEKICEPCDDCYNLVSDSGSWSLDFDGILFPGLGLNPKNL